MVLQCRPQRRDYFSAWHVQVVRQNIDEAVFKLTGFLRSKSGVKSMQTVNKVNVTPCAVNVTTVVEVLDVLTKILI